MSRQATHAFRADCIRHRELCLMALDIDADELRPYRQGAVRAEAQLYHRLIKLIDQGVLSVSRRYLSMHGPAKWADPWGELES